MRDVMQDLIEIRSYVQNQGGDYDPIATKWVEALDQVIDYLDDVFPEDPFMDDIMNRIANTTDDGICPFSVRELSVRMQAADFREIRHRWHYLTTNGFDQGYVNREVLDLLLELGIEEEDREFCITPVWEVEIEDQDEAAHYIGICVVYVLAESEDEAFELASEKFGTHKVLLVKEWKDDVHQ
jgi:hypothetical protein